MPDPQSKQSKSVPRKDIFSGKNKENFPKIHVLPAIIKILNDKLNLR